MGSKKTKKNKEELIEPVSKNSPEENGVKDEAVQLQVNNGTPTTNTEKEKENKAVPQKKAQKRKRKNDNTDGVPIKVRRVYTKKVPRVIQNKDAPVEQKIDAPVDQPKETPTDQTKDVQVDQTKKPKLIKTPKPRGRKAKVKPMAGSVATLTNNGLSIPNHNEEPMDITWSKPDIMQLIDRMQQILPAKDTLQFGTRVEKLNWNEIAFNAYSGEDCKKTWMILQKRTRKFRILSEILIDAKEWIDKPKLSSIPRKPGRPGRLGRPPKHPDMPRRPLSAYLLYFLKNKDQVTKDNPGLEPSEVTKIIGQLYKSLPPENKEEYEKQAAINKTEYNEKRRVFFENHPDLVPTERIAQKFQKRKRPKSESVQLPKVEKEKLPTVETEKLLEVEKEKGKKSTKIENKKAKAEKDKSKAEKEKPPRAEKEIPTKGEKEKLTKADKVNPTKTEKEKIVAPKPEKATKPEKAAKSEKAAKPEKDQFYKDEVPKKCPTPFGLYFNAEMKTAVPETDKTTFRETCKELWKQMSDLKKFHWISLAERNFAKYQDELKSYKARHADFQVPKIKTILTKDEFIIKERMEGKPVRPPTSAYGLYSKQLLQSDEIKLVNPKERMNYCANKWKNISEEDKVTYKEQSTKLMEKYKTDWEAYLQTLPEDRRETETKFLGRKAKLLNTNKRPKKHKETVNENKPKTDWKANEPEQPPFSACKYFAKIYKGEDDPIQAWKALSSEDKRKYEVELTLKKQAYIVEFEKFLNSLNKDELEAFSQSRQQLKSDEESSECSSSSDEEENSGESDSDKKDDDHDSGEEERAD